MKVQRLVLRRARGKVLVGVTRLLLDNFDFVHAAIHLVGGGVHEDRVVPFQPRRFQDVEGAAGVGLEVRARVANGRGHGRLGREMVDDLNPLRGPRDRAGIADVSVYEAKVFRMALAQPGEVLAGAAARKVVENCNGVAIRNQAVGEVSADESCSTGYENPAAGVQGQS